MRACWHQHRAADRPRRPARERGARRRAAITWPGPPAQSPRAQPATLVAATVTIETNPSATCCSPSVRGRGASDAAIGGGRRRLARGVGGCPGAWPRQPTGNHHHHHLPAPALLHVAFFLSRRHSQFADATSAAGSPVAARAAAAAAAAAGRAPWPAAGPRQVRACAATAATKPERARAARALEVAGLQRCRACCCASPARWRQGITGSASPASRQGAWLVLPVRGVGDWLRSESLRERERRRVPVERRLRRRARARRAGAGTCSYCAARGAGGARAALARSLGARPC